ncbi:flagellar biosynthesis anti-sigma factor FlgM [Metasolibacillus sp. FSL H7-0170]|uniref:flagellar biosynthesis anti-sigma factor FlgM n=1 Tax=Metasolibacillus TaxID=2703677 RepID=UPI000791F079|nr:flagellar biosynthesis anti-sigma factor FlgM [Metasolibacillus fluoroglycofenilyticus]KYG91183.1 flagellar biosynthesis anti-sigma factor FlgM [[Bacillus] sp. KCTC 13219]
MKINPLNLRAINPYNAQPRVTKNEEKAASFADKIEISSAAKEMQVTADYNTERAVRVQQLKADIQSGEYKVNARQVAEDMLKYYRF